MRRWRYKLPLRFRSLFLRLRLEREFNEELRFHLEKSIEEKLSTGMTPEEARYSALREMGGVDQIKAECRDMRRVNYIENLGQDLHFCLRLLAKNPGFAAAVVLSLGLGVGANTTMFSFVNALLFRSPAVESSNELLEVWNHNAQASGIESHVPLTYPDYLYYRDHNQVFSGLIAFDGEMRPASWSRSGEGEIRQGQLVSGNFFSILGIKPILGRVFLPEEDQVPGEHPAVVLSHSFWQLRFNSDPDVLGQALTLNGRNFTVVGVAPASFTGIIIGNEPDYWAPLAVTPVFTGDSTFMTSSGSFWLFGIGRLKPGVTRSQAQANLGVLSDALRRAHPDNHANLVAAVFSVDLVPDPFRRYIEAFTGLLMAVAGLVLLIACANAANLLLARAVERRREVAIRSALGASRGRLMQQSLTESLVISLGGCIVGLLFAIWAVPLLVALKPASLPVRIGVPIDWRVLVFAFLLALFSGVVFGLAPALRSSKAGPAVALKEGISLGGATRSRLRSALVITQVAVCTTLLMGAGLCLRSLFNARAIDPGFDTQHVLIAELDPGKLGYSEAQVREFYRELVTRVESLPGVRAASLASHLPLTTNRIAQEVQIDGVQPPPGQSGFSIDTMYIGPRFLNTMQIPLLGGREFTPLDKNAVIVNETMARRYWPRRHAIGQYLHAGDQTLEVIGVMKTGRYRTLSEETQPFMFLPLGYRTHTRLVVSVDGEPRDAMDSVRRAVRNLDPDVVPMDLETMKQYMTLPLFPAHTTGLLLGACGVLALALAVTGLYAVVSYTVGQRTHEIGVRMALGAARSDVMKLILRDGMALALVGVVLGVAAALACTRVLSSLLYGIKPTDPATFLAVSLVMVFVTLFASYVPARWASKVDPNTTLRYE